MAAKLVASLALLSSTELYIYIYIHICVCVCVCVDLDLYFHEGHLPTNNAVSRSLKIMNKLQSESYHRAHRHLCNLATSFVLHLSHGDLFHTVS
jgi:hypothetical protein